MESKNYQVKEGQKMDWSLVELLRTAVSKDLEKGKGEIERLEKLNEELDSYTLYPADEDSIPLLHILKREYAVIKKINNTGLYNRQEELEMLIDYISGLHDEKISLINKYGSLRRFAEVLNKLDDKKAYKQDEEGWEIDWIDSDLIAGVLYSAEKYPDVYAHTRHIITSVEYVKTDVEE